MATEHPLIAIEDVRRAVAFASRRALGRHPRRLRAGVPKAGRTGDV